MVLYKNIKVPKKCNRHVLKAVQSLSSVLGERVPENEIVNEVKYQMRNLVPVRNSEKVIKHAIWQMTMVGLITCYSKGVFGMGWKNRKPPKPTDCELAIRNVKTAKSRNPPKRLRRSTKSSKMFEKSTLPITQNPPVISTSRVAMTPNAVQDSERPCSSSQSLANDRVKSTIGFAIPSQAPVFRVSDSLEHIYIDYSSHIDQTAQLPSTHDEQQDSIMEVDPCTNAAMETGTQQGSTDVDVEMREYIPRNNGTD